MRYFLQNILLFPTYHPKATCYYLINEVQGRYSRPWLAHKK